MNQESQDSPLGYNFLSCRMVSWEEWIDGEFTCYIINLIISVGFWTGRACFVYFKYLFLLSPKLLLLYGWSILMVLYTEWCKNGISALLTLVIGQQWLFIWSFFLYSATYILIFERNFGNHNNIWHIKGNCYIMYTMHISFIHQMINVCGKAGWQERLQRWTKSYSIGGVPREVK